MEFKKLTKICILKVEIETISLPLACQLYHKVLSLCSLLTQFQIFANFLSLINNHQNNNQSIDKKLLKIHVSNINPPFTFTSQDVALLSENREASAKTKYFFSFNKIDS